MNQEDSITDEIKKLVIVRLETLPTDKKISIGKFGDFTKEDIIQHVKDGDEIGSKIIEIELEFLRALKEGILI